MNLYKAGVELDRRAKKYSQEHNTPYLEAMKICLSQDEELAESYQYGEKSELVAAGEYVHGLVLEYMAKHGIKDYSQAFYAVVDQAKKEEAWDEKS